jgi:early secretory antigenic target protein ESAT-6
MSQPFSFSAADAASVEQRIRQVARRMDGDLGDLRAELEDLAAGWSGQAADALRARLAEWDTEMTELTQALALIAEALQRIREAYSDTEAANSQRFQ